MSVISMTATEQTLKNFTVRQAVEAARLRVQAYVDENFDEPQAHMYKTDITFVSGDDMERRITLPELNDISDAIYADTVIYL